MADVHEGFEQWRTIITPFLSSKLKEFHMLGLNHLTLDDFWQFAKETMEGKKEEKPERIHEVVAHVMSLSVNDYMNKLRVDMFKDSTTDLSTLFHSK